MNSETPPMSRQVPELGVAAEDPQAVLSWLTPDLLATWAALHEAPPAIAQAVAQLLPFGSRAGLEELGLIACKGSANEAGHYRLRITPFGYAVMKAAAENSEQGLDKRLSEWEERFHQAVEQAEA